MAGIDGFGVTLARSDMGGTPVFTTIANIASLTPPTESRETSDVTAHDSPDGWREFIGTLADGGSVSLELNFDPGLVMHLTTLRSDFADVVPRDYRIIFPDTGATQIDFEAILTGYAPTSPLDGKMTASVTFKVSGKPVWS